jgi:hypothetical protein
VKQGRYQKKAVLLVTDGEDTTSLTRFDKALQNIREAEMLVYSVGIRERRDSTWEPIHFPETPDRAPRTTPPSI